VNAQRILICIVLLVLAEACGYAAPSQSDLIVEGVQDVSPGMPRMHFIVRREAGQPPLGSEADSIFRMAVVDTGASSICLSEDTVSELGVKVDPNARFVTTGVGGEESSRVSELLIVGLAPYAMDDVEDVRRYESLKAVRCRVKPRKASVTAAGQDIIGMPGLKDRVLVLDPGSSQGSSSLAAEVLRPDDPNIPACPFVIKLAMRSFNDAPDKRDVPPLPTLVASPVVDPVVVEYKGKTTSSAWLLDTGGRISLISTEQAQRLGLVDADGKPLVQPASTLPIVGTGQATKISLYPMDRLVLTDITGRKVIYTNVCIGVHDIRYKDSQTGGWRVLDGVFGCNMLCPAKHVSGSRSAAAFDKVVIDLARLQLGLVPKGSEL
jgi:hypothetical protein